MSDLPQTDTSIESTAPAAESTVPESVEATLARTTESLEQSVEATAPAEALPPPIEAPKILSEELRAVWDKLDPMWQKEYNRLNSNMGRLVSQYGEGNKNWSTINDLWSKHANVFAKGATPIAALQDFIQVSTALRTGTSQQKLETLGLIVETFGLHDLLQQDPSNANPQQGQQPGAPRHPSTGQFLPRDPTIVAKLAELDSWRQSIETERAQELAASADHSLQTWLDSAKPEHYDAVGEVMANLLTQGQATDFADAYEKACALDPTIRQARIDAEVKRALQAADAKAKAARRASVSPVGNSYPQPSGAVPKVNGRAESVEETMQRAMRSLEDGAGL